MLTASAAVGLSSLCAGYAVLTRPLLRPVTSADKQALKGSFDPAPEQKNELATYFLPDQPWAANAAYVVRNGQSVIFFNTWEPIENNTAVRLEPFAMVLPPKPDDEEQQAVTLVGEKAVLRVAGTIELSNPDPGRITGGTVQGEARVRGPENLDLKGRNFSFSEAAERLWSDEPVEFTYSTHSGRGHGLQLELFRVGEPDAFESVAISGVKVLRLLRDVEMDLLIDDRGGGPFGTIAGDSPEKQPASTAPQPTRVTSDGAFTFDLIENIARFDENVVASRMVPNGRPDSLSCDVLQIVLEPGTEQAKAQAADRRAKIQAGTLTEDDGFQATDSSLKPKSLMAFGQNKPAILSSPTNDFRAEITQLTYDAATGFTTLERDTGVVALQGQSRLLSPQIVIEPSQSGGQPAIVCNGQGSLHHYDPPGQLALSAYWSESLRRSRNDGENELIRLKGSATVEQPKEQFTLVGDQIDLWLKPGQSASGATEQGSSLVGSGNLEPVKLIAERNVMLRSREIWADAEKLDVDIVPPSQPASTTALTPRSRLVTTSGEIVTVAGQRSVNPPPAPPPEPAASGPTTPPASAPAQLPAEMLVPDASASPAIQEAKPAEPATLPPQEKPPAEPIELRAQVIAVKVERSPTNGQQAQSTTERGGQVLEVHTSGGVVVRQKRGPDEEPLIIRGERLDILNRGVGQELVNIYGREATTDADGKPIKPVPAHVHDQGADLYGLNVNLDRMTNRAWVDGEGVLLLPTKGAAGRLNFEGESPPATQVETPTDKAAEDQKLTIFWSERMNFDGDLVTFFGNVETMLGGDRMSCEQMEVRLTDRFDFASAGDSRQSRTSTTPEVATVHCKHRVVVNGEEHVDNKLTGRRKAEFSDFILDQRTGETKATGPGYIAMWRQGGGNRAGLAADNAVRANAAVQKEQAAWEFVLVRFGGECDGNIHHRTTTFHRHVKVVYGPVADLTSTIDPDRPDKGPEEAGWMTCGHLTLTRHPKTEVAAAHSEVLAVDNVRLRGRSFSGLADHVTYDESKGQYVLKAFGKRAAVIEYDGPQGKHGGSGQQIQFYPAIGKVHVDKAQGFNGLN